MGYITISTLLKKYKYFGVRKLYWVVRGFIELIVDFVIDNILITSNNGQMLIKRRISRLLITVYGGDTGHNLNYSQYFLGFGLIHYSFVRNIRPKNILCIGSRTGFVPAILALACKDNGAGHVDFVDAGYDRDNPDNWSGTGFWNKHNPNKHFRRLHISPYITTHIMTSRKFADAHSKKHYQYIYIDGDHSYKGVKLDYSLFWPMLTRNGFMVFHDVYVKWTKNLGHFGVWRLWKELKNTHKIIFPFPEESGLGIIQKTI